LPHLQTAILHSPVNDIFVMNAWKSKLAGETTTPIRFLSDKDASWAASVGLLFDASALLGGPRLKRAAIVVVSVFLARPSCAKRFVAQAEC
jgi:2-Cys peroxiredoxin 5